MTTRVFLEVGTSRTFAAALDWPGWCRAGRDEHAALAALADYLPRYAPVIARAGLATPSDTFTVAERQPGTATTNFGAPDGVAAADREPPSPDEAGRIASLVEAVWAEFDAVVAVTPEELRKGPRGGGRDRDKMVDHVLGAEASYARALGVRHKVPALGDTDAIAALRADILAALRAAVPDTKWPVRYAARRVAWHVLDHAWEMQDRA
ncbi:MAG TPA: hypothetical protein VKB69_15200, partial [Micromonosporaceae bacterium]|nr:hypothetical protein [Micromonosporaceae bacterium]